MHFPRFSWPRPLIPAFLILLLAPWLARTQAPQTPSPEPAAKPQSPAAGAQTLATKPAPRKARQAYDQGLREERKGDWQNAFKDYSTAATASPQDRNILLHREIARSQLVMQITAQAEKQILGGQNEAARATLAAALEIDPSYSVARERLAEISDPPPIDLPALSKDENAGPALATGPPKLQARPGAHNFDYRGTTRGAYEEIARQFGVTAAFDADLPDRTIRFTAPGVDFDTAMRLLGEQTNTFWLSADSRTFFVAVDNAEKRRAYEPEVEQEIPLPASETTDEMTETSRMVRDIVGLRRSQLNLATHTLTVRDSLANVALAKALVDEVEQPLGGALLEIDILEVDSTLARNMGITPPTSATFFAITPGELTQLETAASAGALQTVLQTVFGALNPQGSSGAAVVPPLVVLGGGIGTFLATLPGASAQLLETASLVQDAQRVLLRVQDGRPATFFVGEHYPINLAQLSNSLVPPGQTAAQIAAVGAYAGAEFPEANYDVGTSPSGVAIADFNGDGIPDLAVVNQADNTVSILLGTGNGTFGTATTFPTGKGPVAVVAEDFRGNGTSDLAIVDNCTVNPGTGCVATDYAVSILVGNGNGTFQPPVNYTVGTSPVALVSGAFHNTTSSAADLAVVNQGANTVSILLGNGNGTFQPQTTLAVGASPSAIAAADFTNNGYLDLAVTNSAENTFSVLLGNGNGTFGSQTKVATGDGPSAIGAASFITDGQSGVVVANKTDGTISIFPGNGNGTFGAATAYDTGTSPTALIAADVNGDGIPDVTVVNQGAGSVSIFLGLGTGGLASPLTLPVGTSPAAVAIAILTSDGLEDLAVANQGSNTVSVILNSGLLSSLIPSSSTGALQTAYPGSQYVDLGLKVEAHPRIHPDDEMTLDLKFDISSLAGQTVNGIPILDNRTIQQTIRLRENQTSLLSGMISRDETKALSGLPGLVELGPVGYLFGAHSLQKSNTELVIAITPRQLRLAPRADRSIYAGRGAGPAAAPEPAPPAPSGPGPGAGPGLGATPGNPAQPAPASGAAAPPETPSGAAPSPVAAPPPSQENPPEQTPSVAPPQPSQPAQPQQQ